MVDTDHDEWRPVAVRRGGAVVVLRYQRTALDYSCLHGETKLELEIKISYLGLRWKAQHCRKGVYSWAKIECNKQ